MPREIWRENRWDELAPRVEAASPAVLREIANTLAFAATAEIRALEEARAALKRGDYGDEGVLGLIFEIVDEAAEDEDDDAFVRACSLRVLTGALDENPRTAARTALNEGRYALGDEKLTALVEAVLAA